MTSQIGIQLLLILLFGFLASSQRMDPENTKNPVFTCRGMRAMRNGTTECPYVGYIGIEGTCTEFYNCFRSGASPQIRYCGRSFYFLRGPNGQEGCQFMREIPNCPQYHCHEQVTTEASTTNQEAKLTYLTRVQLEKDDNALGLGTSQTTPTPSPQVSRNSATSNTLTSGIGICVLLSGILFGIVTPN